MITITEDYVSFEIAKLLKEKRFDEYCPLWYNLDKPTEGPFFYKEIGWYGHNSYDYNGKRIVSAPTLQMIMKWLREVYHIEISITFGFPFIDGKEQYKYFWSIVKVCNNHLEYPLNNPNNTTYSEEIADSYEQAIEAAIKYCLENLI